MFHRATKISHRWTLLAGALLLGVVAVVGGRAFLGPQVATSTVVRRDFVQTVVASGRVETPHRVDVGAQITSTVVRVPVAEGQAVKAGDVLIELDARELVANERQADVAVAQAQARLRQMREVQGPVAAQTLRQAQVSLDNARAALARNQNLFAQGFIGQAALDDARKNAELADAQVRSAQKLYESASPQGPDFGVALTAVAQAQASAEAAHARSAYASIRASAQGTLIARNVERGDVVQPGKVLMTLSPDGRAQLVVDIDEKNLRLLALGQKARASVDAYPDQRFEAVLVYINPGVNLQTGAVQVKLDVPQPPVTLRQDMTVSVDIEVARRPQALLAPLSAVNDPDGAAPWVLRLEGPRAVRVPVRLGLHSAGWAEVLDGLSEGDAVVPVAAAVQPGAHVRAARTSP